MRSARILTVTLALVAVVAAHALAQATAQPQSLINPNTATEQQLAAQAPLTPALAKTIVERRPFKTNVELNTLLRQSLSAEQATEVYRRVWIPLNLNTASEQEILLIPGVGSRMAHEFEEYRPYRNIQQFRREIGKYVNEQEVARLERYVTLN
jgi:DNA uptake protein ComE-like DNA-binding protein